MAGAQTLDDVCEFIVDCLHKTAPLQDEGYPSIRTPNVGRGRLILDGVNRVSEAVYQEWTQRAVPVAGDLLQDIRDLVEEKLAALLDQNPLRMDYQLKYEQIVTDYNHAKDRTTIENTFRELVALAKSLDDEQRRATREGLSEEELALFDILLKDDIGKADRERLKQASRELLVAVRSRLAELDRFWEKEQTKADVETLILDHVYAHFPDPPFSDDEKKLIAANVYAHVWQQAVSESVGLGAP